MARKSSKSNQLPIGKIVLGAVVLGGGFYVYKNRDTLRNKLAALIGTKPAALSGLQPWEQPRTVVLPGPARAALLPPQMARSGL